MLLMNGTDHLRPQPWLGRVVAEANQIQDDFELVDHLAARATWRAPRRDGLPEWHGELRSGFRSNLLDGRRLQPGRREAGGGPGRAGPRAAGRAALGPLPAGRRAGRPPSSTWPGRWSIRNAAHDSICACSVDDVVDAVLHRYAEARHIGEGLAEQAAPGRRRAPWPTRARWSSTRPPTTAVVWSRWWCPRSASPAPTSRCCPSGPDSPARSPSTARRSGTCSGILQGARIDDDTYVTDVTLAEDETGPRHHHRRSAPSRATASRSRRSSGSSSPASPPGPTPRSGSPSTSRPSAGILARQDAGARASAGPVRARAARPTRSGVEGDPADRAHPGQRPGARWSSTRPTAPSRSTACRATAAWSTTATTATPTTTRRPLDDTVVDTPDSVVVVAGRARDRCGRRATITATYTLARAGRRGAPRRGSAAHGSRSTPPLEVRADEPVVRVRTRFVNPSRDHRLRVHLPLPRAGRHLARRVRLHRRRAGPDRRGTRRGVRPTPTFPSRRFVRAGGLTVVHEGLLEYELVDLADDPPARSRPGAAHPGAHPAAGDRHALASRDVRSGRCRPGR